MQEEEKFEKRKDTAEWIDFSITEFLYDVQAGWNLYDMNALDCYSQTEEILNQSVELELKEEEPEKSRTRGVGVRRDGSGKYYSLENIRFCLLDCIDGIFNLIGAIGKKEYAFIALIIFLFKFMRGIGIDLSEQQTAILVALYQESRHQAVTDNNLETVMMQGLKKGGYDIVEMDTVYHELELLEDYGIIEVYEGKYKVAEKIYFI